MTKSAEVKLIQKRLTEKLMIYIDSIIDIYGKFIPIEKLKRLRQIENYDEIIMIFDYGSINGFATSDNIYMPLSAEKLLDFFSRIPGYGCNESHKLCDEHNLILNDNTFFDYIRHIFASGMTIEEYFQDLLLHETMHFCGSGGANALKEGLNELLTRKLALEKGFRTSGCGYPKEVAIAYELQSIFGEDVINQIAFLNGCLSEITDYLESILGKDASELYVMVYTEMEREFHAKYYKYIDTYDGIQGLLKKANNYKKINYEKVYQMINSYKEKKKIKR